MKLEALNHRGKVSDAPGVLSVDLLAEQTGESKNRIFRLIRLTERTLPLLDKVDAKQLVFTAAVELSYLTQKEQTAVRVLGKVKAPPERGLYREFFPETYSEAQRNAVIIKLLKDWKSGRSVSM